MARHKQVRKQQWGRVEKLALASLELSHNYTWVTTTPCTWGRVL